MAYFISTQGSYYEGDRAHALDQEVPQRPSPVYVWQGAWVLDAALEANRQRLATDTAERQQAQLDAAILALVNATPTQLMTYASNNFPTLTAPERNKMGVILNILAVAVRPQVRQ